MHRLLTIKIPNFS